jgi:hypothetical protein
MPGACQPVLTDGKLSGTALGEGVPHCGRPVVPLDGELARRHEFDRADGLPHTAQLQATGGPRSASSVPVPPEREKTQELMRSRRGEIAGQPAFRGSTARLRRAG